MKHFYGVYCSESGITEPIALFKEKGEAMYFRNLQETNYDCTLVVIKVYINLTSPGVTIGQETTDEGYESPGAMGWVGKDGQP